MTHIMLEQCCPINLGERRENTVAILKKRGRMNRRNNPNRREIVLLLWTSREQSGRVS